MMDVSFLLDDPDFCMVFTVLRRSEAVNSKGRAEHAEERLHMTGVVQPASPREREVLPEGDRDRETLVLYTRRPLRVGSPADGTAPDCVLYGGARYAVAAVETWQGYTRALAQRMRDGE